MHVFRTFKGANTPNTNMAEAGHSRNATRGAKNKSLATVAEEHIVECALLKLKLENYESGTYKGGHCPTQRQKETTTFRRQRDRALQFAKELEAGDINPALYSTSSFVDPSSSHRAPKRTGISVNDDVDTLSNTSSSETKTTQSEGVKTAKATYRKRKRSKVFEKSLSMAKRSKSVTLMQIYDAGPTKKVYELLDSGRIRLVEISETPTCDCGMVSPKDKCMHVIWVMLKKVNINENDSILHQKSIPAAQVRKLLKMETPETTPMGVSNPVGTLSSCTVASGGLLESSCATTRTAVSIASGICPHSTTSPSASSIGSGGLQQRTCGMTKTTTTTATAAAETITTTISGTAQTATSGTTYPHLAPLPTSVVQRSTNIGAPNYMGVYPVFPSRVYGSFQRMPWHNNNPFVVVAINNRIKKCAGCPFEFTDPNGPSFIGLVIHHLEKDFYQDKNGYRMVGRETNRYYHCKSGCLVNRHPYFSPALLRLDPAVPLNSVQQSYLQRVLNVQFRYEH